MNYNSFGLESLVRLQITLTNSFAVIVIPLPLAMSFVSFWTTARLTRCNSEGKYTDDEIEKAAHLLQYGTLTMTHPVEGHPDKEFFPFSISVSDIIAMEIMPVEDERMASYRKMMKTQQEILDQQLRQAKNDEKWRGDEGEES